jgi:hypothetical protein
MWTETDQLSAHAVSEEAGRPHAESQLWVRDSGASGESWCPWTLLMKIHKLLVIVAIVAYANLLGKLIAFPTFSTLGLLLSRVGLGPNVQLIECRYIGILIR